MWVRKRFDLTLFILLMLFAFTLGSFLLGIFPYPYGFFVLLAFIVARFFIIQDKNRS